MNQYMKAILMSLSVLLVSSFSVLAYAEVYSRQDIVTIIQDASDAAALEHLVITKRVYAEGIHSYCLRDIGGNKDGIPSFRTY